MDQGTLQGIATILAMVAFLGVCVWAYSKRRKKDFDEAAQLPFADDRRTQTNSDEEANKSSPSSPQTQHSTEKRDG